MAYRNYSTATSHIVDHLGFGDFTTIGAALTAAMSGQTILIRPGTYIEDPALVAGVNLCAFETDGVNTPNVTILGECSFSSAGRVSISGICLQTNSNYALAVTGSSASNIILQNCLINCSNNTGIDFTTANTGAVINMIDCTSILGATGITLYTMTSTGTIAVYESEFNTFSSNTTASSNSAGNVNIFNSVIYIPLSTSTTGQIGLYGTVLESAPNNSTMLTTAGTGTSQAYNCYFTTGTASAISIGASTTLDLFNSVVNSTNTNAITGAGTLKYGGVTFSGSSSTINTTTQTPFAYPVAQGGTGAGTFTTDGVLYGNTTSALGVTAAATNGQVLLGATSAAPAFGTLTSTAGSVSYTTGTNSLNIDVENFATGTFTPTLVGGSTAGTTTYSTQVGYYTRFLNMCFVQGVVQITGASGTGNINIGGLPFTVKSQTSGACCGACTLGGASAVWPTSVTHVTLVFSSGNTFAVIEGSGSDIVNSNVQIGNYAINVDFSGIFQV